MTLSKDLIQKFVVDLDACKFKSDYDERFLQNHSVEELALYDANAWLEEFEARRIHLLDSDYDWTCVKEFSESEPWHQSPLHSNFQWLEFAKQFAKQLPFELTRVIFGEVYILNDDRRYLKDGRNFNGLCYTVTHDRLYFMRRCHNLLKKKKSTHLASYDAKNFYPLSPYEISQFQKKTDGDNLLNALIPTRQSEFDCSDLLYQLYPMVADYFREFHSPQLSFNMCQNLDQFYQEHLKNILTIPEIYSFYGQCIPASPLSQTNDVSKKYLGQILGQCRGSQDPRSLLPQMIDLAIWITLQNPAMLFEQPEVQEAYRFLKIGPELTRDKLIGECQKLFNYRNDLQDDEVKQINVVIETLKTDESEENVIKTLIKLFRLRDQHNQTTNFTENRPEGVVTWFREYLYYRKDANAQYIRIAQFLAGTGILKRHGIDPIWLLMQDLKVTMDPISLKSYFSYPFSHLMRPEKDRHTLSVLDNSEENYKANECFNKITSESNVAFTLSEFKLIKLFAAKKFRVYERIPSYTCYKLKASTLKALIDLVNNGLNYSGLKDNYVIKQSVRYLNFNEIDIKVEKNGVAYKVRDSWDCNTIHTGLVPFTAQISQSKFLSFNSENQLGFILNHTAKKGHTRPNFSLHRYYKVYLAFISFRAFYDNMDPAERAILNKVSMRFNGVVRTFEEVYANGDPECMTAACKWFATLIIDYLPKLRFRIDLENAPEQSRFLDLARDSSLNLYEKSKENLLKKEGEIYVENDLTSDNVDLNDYLTYKRTYAEIVSGMMQVFGMNTEESLTPEEFEKLLLVVDSDQCEKPVAPIQPRLSALENLSIYHHRRALTEESVDIPLSGMNSPS